MSNPAQFVSFGREYGAEAAWLESVGFDQLRGFDEDNHLDAFRAFLVSASALIEGVVPTRSAKSAEPAFREVCNLAVNGGAIINTLGTEANAKATLGLAKADIESLGE